jgi:restriction system protein
MMPALDASTALAGATALGAAVAFFALRSRARSNAAVRRGESRAVDVTNQREFNALVAEAFRLQGYQIVDSGAGVDADLVLRRERETLLVLCRHWEASKVEVGSVTRLQAAIAARGANGGIALTSGRFARAAVAYAHGCNIKLIEGAALQGLLDKARASRRAAA